MKSLKQLKSNSVRARFAQSAGIPALAVALLCAAPLSVSFAESTPALVEASIPFANYGGIRDWQPDRDRGLWVQSVHRKWYYARFMGTCLGLNFANAIGFDTHPLGSFDRWSTVIVPRYGRCTIQSLSLSDGPPKKVKKPKAGAGAGAGAQAAEATAGEVTLSNPAAGELAAIESAGIEPVTINLARIDPAKGDSSPTAK
ncbi:MAG: DUF6491 family protein [Gammaproteobacteria bacterium]